MTTILQSCRAGSGQNFDAAPVSPASTLQYTKPTSLKRKKIDIKFFPSEFLFVSIVVKVNKKSKKLKLFVSFLIAHPRLRLHQLLAAPAPQYCYVIITRNMFSIFFLWPNP
jgi:hypothetical protein